MLFVLFWIIFYFLLISESDKFQLLIVTFVAILSTIFYLFSFLIISYFYIRLKNNLAEAKKVNLGDKIIFGLRIAIMLAIAPSFIKTLTHITEGNISLLILLIVLFLIPTWMIFSVIIKKWFDSFYLLAVIFLSLIIIFASIFFNAPFLENISSSYVFLTGFFNFISIILFPALLISLIFIEIPSLLRKKSIEQI